VGEGCLGDVGPLLAAHAFDTTCVLVGSGPGPSRMLAERVVRGLREHGLHVLYRPDLEGLLHQAAATAAQIIEEEVTVAVAVGGGPGHRHGQARGGAVVHRLRERPDHRLQRRHLVPIASLRGKDGRRASHVAGMPAGIIVDVEIIGSAPAGTIRAGVGDLVSNLTAVLDWRLAEREGQERYDAFPAMISEAAARPALDLPDLGSLSSREVIANGLLLSGLAMAAAGTSRPCSGAEHLISHSLDAMLGENAGLHGHQVALGCLVSAAAHESPLLEVLQRLFCRLGLPTAPGTSACPPRCWRRRSAAPRRCGPSATRCCPTWAGTSPAPRSSSPAVLGCRRVPAVS
jgi:glycerol-1-phosphate dehydrogenase [NAD(P)+]